MLVRPARVSDVAVCGRLDASYTSELTYQLSEERPSRPGTMELAIGLRAVRLPRPRAVVAPDATAELEMQWGRLGLFLVVEEDERVVGYLGAREDRDLGWIENVVVDGPFRRRRYGSALLAAARAWAVGAELRSLLAAAPTRNHPAVALLRANGFIFCGYNERHFTSGEIALYLAQDLGR